MKAIRVIAVLCIALGLASISIALGSIYIDFTHREGAWMELTSRHAEPTEEQRQRALEAWRDDSHAQKALIAGTIGVALFGAGCALALFELPVFDRNPKPLNSGS